MPKLKLYNTLSRSVEEFTPNNPPTVLMYACGPTVYGIQHIGNLRAAYFADIVYRTLEYLGYSVKFVRNYTDVGHLDGDNAGNADEGTDRMEKGSKKEGLTPEQIADKYIKQYDEDVKKLGTLKPTFTPRATETIKEIVEMVQILYDKGYAYITPEAIYFDVSKFPNYNNLNRQKPQENLEGAGHGTAEIEHKKNPQDFSLWFFRYGQHVNHIQHWNLSDFWKGNLPKELQEENPFGDGFPGWHIECSAMSKKFLGPKLDLHLGGIEHIPTHHTNEIAQSESANSEKPFVKYWLHFEHLLVDNSKMSKSMGNGYSISDLEDKGFSAMDLRYFFLTSNYRSIQNFTWDALNDAKSSHEKLRQKYQDLKSLVKVENEISLHPKEQTPFAKAYEDEFLSFITNDFNVSGALATIWKLIKDENVNNYEKFELLNKWQNVLGLDLNMPILQKEIDDNFKIQIETLINDRKVAKQNKDYKLSDEIRDRLNRMGVEIMDTPNGTEWKIK